MTRRIDAAILIFCLVAAAGAECILLMLGLLAAAGALTILKEVRTMNYRTCPDRGAHLDAGERRDCQDKEEAAPSATNTGGDKAEQGLTANVHASKFI